MTFAQVYCTAKEVMNDLKISGFVDQADLMDRIKAASDIIRQKGGNFIPITETRKFGVDDPRRRGDPLYIPPLLDLTTLVNDGTTIASGDYILRPLNRMWANGPYICIESGYLWGDDDDIEITGKWGKYDDSASLGATITQATATETTLVVTDGSLISPGMVLLIESEQEYAAAGAGGPGSPAASAATSKVNGAVTEVDEDITVDNGAEFHAGEVIQIGTEDIYIQKIGGNVLAVKRGWNGTTQAAHVDDSAIAVYRTFTVVRGVNGTTAAAHSAKAASQILVPETVNYLCRQIAALMRNKAESGFTGITGNNEMGSGKYYSEFPPNQIATVLDMFNTGD